jgi:ElaB/YqjD/DUF883 family membrane-anchored ribosome-binding protein
MQRSDLMICIKERTATQCHSAGRWEAAMTGKDTFGCEQRDISQLLRKLVTALENIVASESADAVEQARTVLNEVRPLVDRAIEAPDRLKEAVRQHPLLALGAAALAGFALASLRRR